MLVLPTLLLLLPVSCSRESRGQEDRLWVFKEVRSISPEEVVFYIDDEDQDDLAEDVLEKQDWEDLEQEPVVFLAKTSPKAGGVRLELALVLGVVGGVVGVATLLLVTVCIRPRGKVRRVEDGRRREVEELEEEGRMERRRIEQEVRRRWEGEAYISPEVYI